jgi:hypothetical protein
MENSIPPRASSTDTQSRKLPPEKGSRRDEFISAHRAMGENPSGFVSLMSKLSYSAINNWHLGVTSLKTLVLYSKTPPKTPPHT